MHKPPTCEPCPLFNISNGFSSPEGSGKSGVIMMGEALGYDEYLDGLPFRPRAQAGSKLEECIRNVGNGITRDDFVLWNIVACNPPDNQLTGMRYQDGAIQCCSQYRTRLIGNFKKRREARNGTKEVDGPGSDRFLFRENRESITIHREKSNSPSSDYNNPSYCNHNNNTYKITILALGNTAFQTLTSDLSSVLDVAGYPFPLRDTSWATIPDWAKDISVIGSYHPSYIKRGNPHLTPLLTEDIKIALETASGARMTKAEYKSKCSWHFVGHDEAESYYYRLRDNPRLIIAHDIETATAGYVAEDERGNFTASVGSLDPNEDITQIQFATDKYRAIIFPNFDGKYRALAKKILELPNLKANHNTWNFDNPRLREKYGIKIDESRVHDTMWMFKKWYPKLPAGLQRVASLAGFPFAWKMLFGADPEEYGGADVCAIHWILEWLPGLMKQRGCWEGYYRYTYQLHPILERAASREITHFVAEKWNPDGTIAKGTSVSGGLPINDRRRLELKIQLEERQRLLDIEVQKLVPGELRNIKPNHQVKIKTGETKLNKKGKEVAIEKRLDGIIDYGYTKEPKKILTATRARYEAALQTLSERQTATSKLGEAKIPSGEGEGTRKYEPDAERATSDELGETETTRRSLPRRAITLEAFIKKACSLEQRSIEAFDRKTGESKGQVTRWVKVEPFKASMDQLLRYIKWKKATLAKSSSREDRQLSKRYYVPTTHKGKETTRKDEIELLFDKTGDELLQMVLEHRSLTTNIRNYIPNWAPSVRTGCVHTTWGFTAPSGQLNSSAPNVLNISKHTEIGQLFRRIIEAPEGWEFLELDKKSFHVATMGYCANDASYIRFSQLDPHSIFVSYIMPPEWGSRIEMSMSDGEILERSSYIKKRCKQRAIDLGKPHGDIRQYQAKPTVLGNQLGLGPHKLYWQNRRSMESLQDAIRYQGILSDLFPKVEAFKAQVKMDAARATYLVNEFGCIEHYFDVFNFRWNKKRMDWDRSEGDEARNPVAMRVQGAAFGMIKEELYRILGRLGFKAPKIQEPDPVAKGLWRDVERVIALEDVFKGVLPYFPFRMSIHDSLMFLARRSDRERLLGVALEEMNRPCARLRNAATDSMGSGGLRIGVEWSAGRNLQGWDEEKNPEGMREGG